VSSSCASDGSDQKAAERGPDRRGLDLPRKIAKPRCGGCADRVNRELDRLERTSEQKPGVRLDPHLLDWMLDIPWNVRSEDNYDLNKARQSGRGPHRSLGREDRIIEFLLCASCARSAGSKC